MVHFYIVYDSLVCFVLIFSIDSLNIRVAAILSIGSLEHGVFITLTGLSLS